MREVYLRLQLLYYYPITWGGMLEIFKSKKKHIPLKIQVSRWSRSFVPEKNLMHCRPWADPREGLVMCGSILRP